ncbi:MAG: sulfite exporter TauE/SafE family protein [Bdellovibrionales bacterium]|nr:sulfite exporter TauE/SafE family protein [Bdellovibrionales bacterium]
MTIPFLAFLTWSTSLLSGIFGMAGGIVLMGFLTQGFSPVQAILLHGIIQGFANFHRSYEFRHGIDWKGVGRYAFGAATAYFIMRWVSFVPDKKLLYLILGFVALAGAWDFFPKMLGFERPFGAVLCGLFVSLFQLLAGVAGPLLDLFFRDRKIPKEKVVGTKSATQVISHGLKVGLMVEFSYRGISGASDILPLDGNFIGLAIALLASALGTWMGKQVLIRMKQEVFYAWTGRILAVIGVFYIGKATLLYREAMNGLF